MTISRRRQNVQRATLRMRGVLAPAYLLLCLLLGGASAAGVIANGVLQLLAVALIAWALVDPSAARLPPHARPLVGIAIAALLLILVQLIPLPPAIWSALPGRDLVVEGYRLAGMELPWLPISLAPSNSLTSALALLPAAAVALLILRMPAAGLDDLRWLIPALAVLSVLIGLGQIAGGGQSSLYFYDFTNRGMPVGFFANANHLATLILIALPFLAALEARRRNARGSRHGETGRKLLFASVAGLLLLGIAMNGSVAGYGLLAPVAIASWMLLRRNRAAPVSPVAILLLVVAAIVAIAIVTYSPLIAGIGTTFSGPLSRPDMFAKTAAAAWDHFPLGSGLGSFQSVFPLYENPDTITATFANHAHNDYVELLLETGLPGLILILLFLWWWGRRAIAIWSGAGERIFLERAATIGSAVVIVHSLVDYPARTAAIMALFAAMVAIMAQPAAEKSKAEKETDKSRHVAVD